MSASHLVPGNIAKRVVSRPAHAERTQLFADLSWLRSNNPVGLVQLDDFNPFWLVTRHDDVLRMSRENDLFVNSKRPAVITGRDEEAEIRARSGTPSPMRLLINMDAEDHANHRRILQDWFSAARIAKLQADIKVIAAGSIRELEASGGTCDFANDIATRYTARVLMKIIGMPMDDEDFLIDTTQTLFMRRDPDPQSGSLTPGAGGGRAHVTMNDFITYVSKLTEARRRRPSDDLASAIAGARIDGSPISDMEAIALYINVLAAGHETTSSATAGAIWGLCEYPDELEKARARPDLVNGLVEEAVRWTSPVCHFMRSAARETTLGGRRIERGDWLMMSYLSANRDERLIDEPERFVIDRPTTSKVAFGGGSHACLGQYLTRLEMRIFFEELLPRMSEVCFAGTPRRSQSLFLGGPSSLPVSMKLH